MADILTVKFISDIRESIWAKISAICTSMLFITIICLFIILWMITICLYLAIYMVLTPVVLIKIILTPRTKI